MIARKSYMHYTNEKVKKKKFNHEDIFSQSLF